LQDAGRVVRKCLAQVATLVLAACASPTAVFDQSAARLGFDRDVMTGTRFHHVVYRKDGQRTKTLHVYLDGDGTPWIDGRAASDPTPRNALVLRLLAQDPATAAYVGRPCYDGTATDALCSQHLWTRDRYSEEVVASMAAIVSQLMTAGRYETIAWFGHSGGGTLAVLLARRFSQTRLVVTVAGDLDTAAWAKAIAHEDLDGSLNPADGPPLAPEIRQRHYAGARDRIVPPDLMANAAAHLGAGLTVIDTFDHVCCWERLWPAILAAADMQDGPPH
jgi:pimeloyl-ACP methyl ester carboxylesterase